jgi:molybdate transport system ATP-binding protein
VVALRDGLAEIAIGSSRLFGLSDAPPDAEVDVCIRAADVTLQRSGAATPGTSSARNRLGGRVRRLFPEGAVVRIEIDAGFPLSAMLTRQAFEELGLAEGAPVIAVVKATAVHVVRRA